MSQAVLTRHVHPKQRGIQGIAEKDKATNNQTRSVHLNNLPETGVLHKPARLFQENRHTHTHLFRKIIANLVVECILRAKTLQLHLTGMGR